MEEVPGKCKGRFADNQKKNKESGKAYVNRKKIEIPAKSKPSIEVSYF